MIHLIIYNQKGEVKAVEMEMKYFGYFEAIPQENYFIKGLIIDGMYLTSYQIQKILSLSLTPLENHFLTVRYGFFSELTFGNFRNEYTRFTLTIDDNNIIQHLKNTGVLSQL